MNEEEKTKYYSLDIKGLINNIKYNNQIRDYLLKDRVIKYKLINSDKNSFITLLKDLNEGSFKILFDEIGLEILSKSNNSLFELTSIIKLNKYNIDYLFENNNILNLIFNNFRYFLDYINYLSIESILQVVNKSNNNQIYNIFKRLDDDKQLTIIKNIKIPDEMLKLFIINSNSKTLEYLLFDDLRINFINELDYETLYKLFSKNIRLPEYILNDKELVNKITTILNPKDYRYLMDELSKNNIVTNIENKRKKYYENEIYNYNKENNMLNNFSNAYREIINLLNVDNDNLYDEFNNILDKYFNSFSPDYLSILKSGIVSRLNDLDELKIYFQKESNLLLTEMIIDYYFEQNYYNFFIDLNELIRFQNTEGKSVSDENLKIYKKISNLDNLSYNEKLNLFNELKNFNIMEKYYDDFRSAKNSASSLMKEKMLNFNNINNYKNEELTKKYGVNVYSLDGCEFYAFVKSLKVIKNKPLTKEMISAPKTDGSSYSLDSSYKLDTYFDTKGNYNLIFGDFNIDSIVHTFYRDSYSRYHHSNELGLGTKYHYELNTPYEFVTKSPNYNEIIYAQKNYNRNDELNDKLDVPKLLGIYVYDEITPLDIESARNLGCGIVVVNTKKYNIDNTKNNNELEDKVYLNDYNENHRVGR